MTLTLAILSGLVRINESSFSEVHTKMSHSSMSRRSPVASPMPSPTVNPTAFASSTISVCFSLARAFSGTMYTARLPGWVTNKRWRIPK